MGVQCSRSLCQHKGDPLFRGGSPWAILGDPGRSALFSLHFIVKPWQACSFLAIRAKRCTHYPRAGHKLREHCTPTVAQQRKHSVSRWIAQDHLAGPLLFCGQCKAWRVACVLLRTFSRARSYTHHDARHSRLARIARKLHACHGLTSKCKENQADRLGSPRIA